jgi:uncharacterized damage-inducible protein DinB
MKPALGTYPEYFQRYIGQVKEENLLTAMESNSVEAIRLFQSIPEEKSQFAYAEGKWTIKEVIQHIIDSERVFGYRALAFSRKDENSLPSFDENKYATYSQANSRNLDELIEEFFAVRKSSQLLFTSFSETQLSEIGMASGKSISVLALGFIIAGHCIHHLNILQERYLN